MVAFTPLLLLQLMPFYVWSCRRTGYVKHKVKFYGKPYVSENEIEMSETNYAQHLGDPSQLMFDKDQTKTLLFSKWPETTVKYVKEDWSQISTSDYDNLFTEPHDKYAGYEGLLLSTCQTVPMFATCKQSSMKNTNVRHKLDYETFYRRPVIETEWSTFDAFSVLDCSQLKEKWKFFTGQECKLEPYCTVRNVCLGIHCQCCEELRCLALSSWMSVVKIDGNTINNGSIIVKNCSMPETPEEYRLKCTGTCSTPDLEQIGRFLNATCSGDPSTGTLCDRELAQCHGLRCRCCDTTQCYLSQRRGNPPSFKALHHEDVNMHQVSNIYGEPRDDFYNDDYDSVSHLAAPSSLESMTDKDPHEAAVPNVHYLFPMKGHHRETKTPLLHSFASSSLLDVRLMFNLLFTSVLSDVVYTANIC